MDFWEIPRKLLAATLGLPLQLFLQLQDLQGKTTVMWRKGGVWNNASAKLAHGRVNNSFTLFFNICQDEWLSFVVSQRSNNFKKNVLVYLSKSYLQCELTWDLWTFIMTRETLHCSFRVTIPKRFILFAILTVLLTRPSFFTQSGGSEDIYWVWGSCRLHKSTVAHSGLGHWPYRPPKKR
jgi:hypothetical protein